jgi:hypothetical protein
MLRLEGKGKGKDERKDGRKDKDKAKACRRQARRFAVGNRPDAARCVRPGHACC